MQTNNTSANRSNKQRWNLNTRDSLGISDIFAFCAVLTRSLLCFCCFQFTPLGPLINSPRYCDYYIRLKDVSQYE